jgi:DNA topoisomerase-6 subunit B
VAQRSISKPQRKTRPRRGRAIQASLNLDAGKETPEPVEAKAPAAPPEPEPVDGGEATPRNGGRSRRAPRPRGPAPTAVDLAKKQREISVSEFFAKNRHLLGFDNPKKSLLTAVKEAVDNALDACEDAHVLPNIRIDIREIREDRYRVIVEDSGPGIVKNQIPKIFGMLLYGSKFHARRQSRGQQGIGISAAALYGQITTGKPIVVVSRTGPGKKAHRFEILIDTNKNAPIVAGDAEVDWERERGTRIELELEGIYQKGKRSVDDYVEQTALANPHAQLFYRPPKGEPIHFSRTVNELPPEPREIRPHPHGVELGLLMKMLKETKCRNVRAFLTTEFSRVSARVAEEILAAAHIEPSASPARTHRDAAEDLYQAIQKVKIMAPPTDCLSPIGEAAIESSLREQVKADFYTAVTRSPVVYRGNPFQIEVGLAYGGEALPADEPATLFRLANRVPLLYQQSACAITKAAISTAWRNYGITQPRGALPAAPMVLMVHMASVWVPFTSESKEAVAHYPEIIRELRLALQDCGRRLGVFLSRRRRAAEADRKRSYIEKYIPHVGIALREILGLSERQEVEVVEKLTDTLERSRKV